MSSGGSILFRDVQVEGTRTDVLVVGDRIHRLGSALRPRPDGEVVDGDGGALLPGLHDHHIHLAALAAMVESVVVGPPVVTNASGFAAALAAADGQRLPGRWIRAVGYHESVAGPLDRTSLDRLVPDRPLRVQDRSGKRWTLNSHGLAAVGAEAAEQPGILRDRSGHPTGVVERADDWLSAAIGSEFPDLGPVGRLLAAVGVTGVTDCTPYSDGSGPAAIAAAVDSGRLPQTVHITGGVELTKHDFGAALRTGPVKILLDEDRLPLLDDLVEWIRAAHRAGRSVAIHVVTAATLALALAAWDTAGVGPGDRIEHGSVIVPAALERLAGLGLTVVTQPGFVAERGDRYLVDVDEDERPHLYRCASLLAAGIPVAGSSDAPFTEVDPWRAMHAATERRTPSGAVLGEAERLSVDRALRLFTGAPDDPGRTQRRVAAGSLADLCLLGRPLTGSTAVPTALDVRATYRAGVRI